MKCLSCGATMTKKRENHKYAECGLPGITLVGVEVRRCPGCGEVEVSIEAIEELHKAIARAVIMKPERLTPEEVRFLRKHLGLSSRDLASTLGVTPETVSRWENDKVVMEAPADKLLRLLVARKEPVEHYEDELKGVAVSEARPIRIHLRRRNNAWAKTAAA